MALEDAVYIDMIGDKIKYIATVKLFEVSKAFNYLCMRLMLSLHYSLQVLHPKSFWSSIG